MKKNTSNILVKDSGMQIGDSVNRIGMEKKGIYEITELRRVYIQIKSKTTGKITYAKVRDLAKLSADQVAQSTTVASVA